MRFKEFIKSDNFIYLAASVIILAAVNILDPAGGAVITATAWQNFTAVIGIVMSVMILIGLINAWVKTDYVVKHIGHDSGFKGLLKGSLMGVLLTGPVLAVFPMLKALWDKGARTAIIAALITSWGGIRLPLIPMEISLMGWKFFLVRNALVLVIIIPAALIIEKAAGD